MASVVPLTLTPEPCLWCLISICPKLFGMVVVVGVGDILTTGYYTLSLTLSSES